ncbi:hypothetical protein XPA_001490 [Xanthoria parietina]
MSPSDYTSAKSGTLRLKGVHPTAKIQKPKKKRPNPSSDPTTASVSKSKKPAETPDHTDPDPEGDANEDSAKIEDEERDGGEGEPRVLRGSSHEQEAKRKQKYGMRNGGGGGYASFSYYTMPYYAILSVRDQGTDIIVGMFQLEDRLKREGTKTHKEKVEEFNHYLSNLSEHHDMPRIGPG